MLPACTPDWQLWCVCMSLSSQFNCLSTPVYFILIIHKTKKSKKKRLFAEHFYSPPPTTTTTFFCQVNAAACLSMRDQRGHQRRQREQMSHAHIVLTWISFHSNPPPGGGHLFRAICVSLCASESAYTVTDLCVCVCVCVCGLACKYIFVCVCRCIQ